MIVYLSSNSVKTGLFCRIHHIYLMLFLLLGSCLNALAVTPNIDSPNIGFSNGNFTNWQLYTGSYYRDKENSDENTVITAYDWQPVDWSKAKDHFDIMNLHKDDDIIACSEFKKVPADLTLTARIGAPGKAEGNAHYNTGKATAERMVYTFTVTENTTLLNYRYACVVRDPTNSNNPHNGQQRPTFLVNITSFDPKLGQPVTLPCAQFEAIANSASSDLTQNPACKASSVGSTKAVEYWFKNWTSAAIDLRDYIGQKVTVEIINHDCLSGDVYGSGVHDAYGYFWAETRKLELISKNCGEEDPTISAPEGFDTYKWSRSDNGIIKYDPENPRVITIPRASLFEGVTYTCSMSNSGTDCSAIVMSTQLTPIEVKVGFTAKDSCGGKVNFTNRSSCLNDSIVSYTWMFGDGTMGFTKDAEHYYESDGDVYRAKLYATTSLGCTDSSYVDLAIPLVPKLTVDGLSNVCQGEKVKLSVFGPTAKSIVTWNDGTQGFEYNLIADTSRKFTIRVDDEYGCTYYANKNLVVRQVPDVYIIGDSATCVGDSVVLVANNAYTYSWNTGMVSDSLIVRPQGTSTYSVVGKASNGCEGVASITVVVNPLPTITIEGPTELCLGTESELKASGGVLYQWSDLYTGGTRTINPTEMTKYTVRGTDINKCSNTASWTVNVKDIPEIGFSGDTLVCAGEIARVTVSGADNFVWGDGSEQNYYAQLLSNDTVWTVTGTANGCSSKLNIPITIKPAPYVYINGDTRVCHGDTLTLWGVGAQTYQWATGFVGDTLKSKPDATAIYQVIGTGANGCSRMATTEVVVLPLPTVSITGDMSVCQNSLAKLYAKGNANAYYWNTGSISDSIVPLINEPTWFKVKGMDMNGCAGIDSFKVGVIPPPNLSFTGETEICSGSSTMLVMSGASSYKWNNGYTGANYNASPSMDTTYVVTGYLNGCSSQISIPISLRQSPVVWAEGITQICQGDTLHLLAKGAKNYIWGNGTSNEMLEASPLTSCVYHLIGTDSVGCQGQTDIAVNVRLRPIINIKGDIEVCEGSTASLTAYGDAVLYTWSNGQVGQTINPIILKETEFTVKGTDSHTCTNTASFVVRPVLPPTLSFLGDTAVCVGGTIDLVAQGATDYIWQDSVKGSEFVFQPKASCYIKLTGISHNCSASKMLTVNVLTPPNILISGDENVCPGENFTITAQGASRFTWSTGDTTASISYAPQVATTYYATGYDVNNCSTTKSFTVNVNALPEIGIKLLSYRGCPGSKDTAVVQAVGGTYYEWTSEPPLNEVAKNVNSNKLAVLLSDTTTLYLYGRDLNGCANETELTLNPLPRKHISFAIEPKWIEPSNPTVTMKGVTPSDAVWYWTPGDGSREQVGRLFHYRYDVDRLEDSVEVSVRAIDTIGCTYTGSEYLYVWKDFWAPTGFTPNNDEKNETFHFYGGKYITDFHFYIFNRQGDIVFEGNSFDAEWDGTFNGKDCPWGVYGWVANYNSDVRGTNFSGERKGMVTIVR